MEWDGAKRTHYILFRGPGWCWKTLSEDPRDLQWIAHLLSYVYGSCELYKQKARFSAPRALSWSWVGNRSPPVFNHKGTIHATSHPTLWTDAQSLQVEGWTEKSPKTCVWWDKGQWKVIDVNSPMLFRAHERSIARAAGDEAVTDSAREWEKCFIPLLNF